jgi:hypothetical protein
VDCGIFSIGRWLPELGQDIRKRKIIWRIGKCAANPRRQKFEVAQRPIAASLKFANIVGARHQPIHSLISA